MPARTDQLDLGTLGLTPGEGRRLSLEVSLPALELAGQTYAAVPPRVVAVLDIALMVSHGYSLRLRFNAGLDGLCMRCLDPAAPAVDVDTREIDQPGGGDDLESPYVDGQLLDLGAWAHDAFALAAPDQVLCRGDCLGLCAECAANLNQAGSDHHHETPPDTRWAKLQELRFD